MLANLKLAFRGSEAFLVWITVPIWNIMANLIRYRINVHVVVSVFVSVKSDPAVVVKVERITIFII